MSDQPSNQFVCPVFQQPLRVKPELAKLPARLFWRCRDDSWAYYGIALAIRIRRQRSIAHRRTSGSARMVWQRARRG
jgi:hypothetical protein